MKCQFFSFFSSPVLKKQEKKLDSKGKSVWTRTWQTTDMDWLLIFFCFLITTNVHPSSIHIVYILSIATFVLWWNSWVVRNTYHMDNTNPQIFTWSRQTVRWAKCWPKVPSLQLQEGWVGFGCCQALSMKKRKRNTLQDSKPRLLPTLVWCTTVSKIRSEYNISNLDFKSISVPNNEFHFSKPLMQMLEGTNILLLSLCLQNSTVLKIECCNYECGPSSRKTRCSNCFPIFETNVKIY